MILEFCITKVGFSFPFVPSLSKHAGHFICDICFISVICGLVLEMKHTDQTPKDRW